ncbi:uncharacterized protein LOC111701647 [Eurytemora carolleeae]|uniref:uncharacterized protein LOC111701647 n=1 Tax=Eurytemora carolleeae TaxID=1294199 RepID=UPI000C78FF99|nr:uncharacterized protein LOC111701647 [Eurytemora carolleeae]|eukprot:XP_023328793.1 uncharacterized protein LOC111701647 [Eurytemora affinis]
MPLNALMIWFCMFTILLSLWRSVKEVQSSPCLDKNDINFRCSHIGCGLTHLGVLVRQLTNQAKLVIMGWFLVLVRWVTSFYTTSGWGSGDILNYVEAVYRGARLTRVETNLILEKIFSRIEEIYSSIQTLQPS